MRFNISAAEARMVKNQLHVAYLIAQRNNYGGQQFSGTEFTSSDAVPAVEAHAADEGLTADALPAGWAIWPEGGLVHFEVPASAADGDFALSRLEAAVVGIVLLWLSMPSSLREDLTESETSIKWRSGQLRLIGRSEWAKLFGGSGGDLSDDEQGGAK
ncbi:MULTISPECIES: hypothetical protein [Mycobacteriaceae]|uniref:hypothetical protein n=1 Tax=Mycobacteriaceae TaxID=1762 RepID=UPI0012F7EBAD|nr:hypothetical protein [Mycobacterium sp. IS-1742]